MDTLHRQAWSGSSISVNRPVPILGCGLLLLLLVLASPAQSATFNVPNGDVVVLRSALNVANSNDESDTINLAAGSSYNISNVDNVTNGPNALPVVVDDVSGHDLTINGNGATIARSTGGGTPDFRLLFSQGTVTINNLTLGNGRIVGSSGVSSSIGGAGQGGGILNHGALTLNSCTLSGNNVVGGQGGPGQGGAIFNNGTLIVSRCTFSGNVATGARAADSGIGGTGGTGGSGQGAALYHASGTMALANSTLSANVTNGGSGGDGELGGVGGHSFGAAIYTTNALALTNCTLTANTAIGGPGGFGNEQASWGFGFAGGLWQNAGTTTLRNTIVAGNSAAGNPDAAGSFGGDYNLVQNTSGITLAGTHNVTGLGANLGPLQANGGTTFTHALLPGSPAINAGDNAVTAAPFNLSTDQRGLARKLGANVDIGAFEFDAGQTSTSLQVTNTGNHDDGACGTQDCTLLEALNAANANANANTITFKAGLAGTISNNSLPLGYTISTPVTIIGPGARILAITGNNANRIFNVSAGVSTISGLTLREGAQLGANATGAAASAGAIFNYPGATLTLNQCLLFNNTARGGNGGSGANGGGAYGGAIDNQGVMTLNNCTFAANNALGGQGGFAQLGGLGGNGGAAFGGAIHNAFNTLTLNNCTFTGNLARGGQGGGAEEGPDGDPGSGGSASGGAIAALSALNMTSVTISGNTADGGARGVAVDTLGAIGTATGGGIWIGPGSGQLRNSIVAGNSRNGGGSGPDVSGGFNSGGFNLIGDTTNATGFTNATDQAGGNSQPVIDAKLGPLANNGGQTDTRALLAGSPALDKGENFGLTTDQRGQPRPADNAGIPNATGGDGSDIGAFEAPGSSALPSISGRIVNGQGAPIAGVNVGRGGGASVLTASDGTYTFSNVPNGTYTLTPVKSGYIFNPANRNVTVNSVNVVNQNFTGYNATLGGRVAFSNGTGIANVQVRLNNGRNALTNGAGYYTFAGVLPGSYTVTPVLAGYTFDPAYRQVAVGSTNVSNVNFIGGYTISGRIANSSGVAIVNQRVTRSGSSTPVFTNSAGYYFFYGVVNGSYTITPTPGAYGFNPQSRNVTVNGASIANQNFIGTSGYSVAGRITTSGGVAIAGVTVTRTGGTTAITNSAGYYTFNGVPNGSYTLTPTKAGNTFTPANRSVTVNGANVANQNFIGSGP